MEKIIKTTDGREVRFVANGATAPQYRNLTGADLMVDLSKLTESIDSDGSFKGGTLEVLENIAYVMAKAGCDNKDEFPGTPEEWLEDYDMFFIYEIFPELIDLWGMNTKTLSKSKKK